MSKTPPAVFQAKSGILLNYNNPDPADIKASDVAAALGRLPRWLGHTKRFFSVAEHCTLMSLWIEAEAPAAAGDQNPIEWQARMLLAHIHDAHEAYMGDLPSPFKKLLGKKYSTIANRLEQAAHAALVPERILQEALHLPRVQEYVRDVDQKFLNLERKWLLREPTSPWGDPTNIPENRHDISPDYYSESTAAQMWLFRLENLRTL